MDMEFASTADYALTYWELGFQIVPAAEPKDGKSWKRPIVKWRELENQQVSKEHFDRWFGPNGEHLRRQNIGIICGKASSRIFIVDIDLHKNVQAKAWWQSVVDKQRRAGDLETVWQTTGGGGIQLLFRAPSYWTPPTIKTIIGVDIRGQGGFAILPPSLHESGRRYEWAEGHEPWNFEIADAPDWLCEEIDALARNYGNLTQTDPVTRTESPAHQFNEFGLIVDGREDLAAKIVWACIVDLYRDAPIRPPPSELDLNLRKAFDIYLSRVKSRLPPETGVPKAALLEREGRGITMFRQKWDHAVSQWDHKVREHASLPRPERAASEPRKPASGQSAEGEDWSAATAEKPPEIFETEEIFPINITDVPPRPWIIPGLTMHGHLSILVAPGGSGKSQLTLQMGIITALGMDWAGWKPRKPQKVLIINAEDDRDEMRRRLYAAAEHMNIDQESLRGKLLIAKNIDDIVIAQSDPKTKAVHRTPKFDQLRRAIQAQNIGLVVVDPFAETFIGDENANSEIKWAAATWRALARVTDCSVYLVHHTKKHAGAMAGDPDASRGGGSIINTARVVSTLFTMTADDAASLGVDEDERHRYVRFDDAKANLTLITNKAKWFEKVGVNINNGRAGIPSDEIGVLSPWSPPSAFENITSSQVNLCLDRIRDGIPGENPSSPQFYTFSKTSLLRYVGTVVGEVLGVDANRAERITKTWRLNGLLAEETFSDPVRNKTTKVVRVVESKRPGRTS